MTGLLVLSLGVLALSVSVLALMSRTVKVERVLDIMDGRVVDLVNAECVQKNTATLLSAQIKGAGARIRQLEAEQAAIKKTVESMIDLRAQVEGINTHLGRKVENLQRAYDAWRTDEDAD